MVTIETISIVFTGISISLAAFYYINTLKNAQRARDLSLKAQEQASETRQAQLFMQIYSMFSSDEFFERGKGIIQTEFESPSDFLENHISL